VPAHAPAAEPVQILPRGRCRGDGTPTSPPTSAITAAHGGQRPQAVRGPMGLDAALTEKPRVRAGPAELDGKGPRAVVCRPGVPSRPRRSNRLDGPGCWRTWGSRTGGVVESVCPRARPSGSSKKATSRRGQEEVVVPPKGVGTGSCVFPDGGTSWRCTPSRTTRGGRSSASDACSKALHGQVQRPRFRRRRGHPAKEDYEYTRHGDGQRFRDRSNRWPGARTGDGNRPADGPGTSPPR